MQVGDLVIVKEGCGRSSGKVGVLLSTADYIGVGRAFCDVLFPEGVKNLRVWWLERLEVPDANR